MGTNARGKNNVWNLKVHLNKKAFDAVFDTYLNLKSRRSISAVAYSDQSGSGGANRARPSPSDFFCDVENTLRDVIDDKKLLKKVYDEYIIGIEVISKSLKAGLEQRIGAAFIKRRLFPVVGKRGYFTAIKK